MPSGGDRVKPIQPQADHNLLNHLILDTGLSQHSGQFFSLQYQVIRAILPGLEALIRCRLVANPQLLARVR